MSVSDIIKNCTPLIMPISPTLMRDAEKHERENGIKFSKISEASMINIRLTLLPAWIDMIARLRIGQVLRNENKFFKFNCLNNEFEFEYNDWEGNPSPIMPFDEFVTWNVLFLSERMGYKLI